MKWVRLLSVGVVFKIIGLDAYMNLLLALYLLSIVCHSRSRKFMAIALALRINLRLRCTVCSLIIHEQILLFVSSATLIFMNYALNMKVYCIPASQIASPCFPISSQRGRP